MIQKSFRQKICLCFRWPIGKKTMDKLIVDRKVKNDANIWNIDVQFRTGMDIRTIRQMDLWNANMDNVLQLLA